MFSIIVGFGLPHLAVISCRLISVLQLARGPPLQINETGLYLPLRKVLEEHVKSIY